MTNPAVPLVIKPIAALPEGQTLEPLKLEPGDDRTLVVGRTSAADWTVPHLSISRRHAAIERRGEDWLITDLGSRHGTFVNGEKLAPEERLPLRPGDEIRLGAWSCRCDAPHTQSSRLTSIIDEPPTTRHQVQKVDAAALAGVAQARLDALIDASRALEHAADRQQVAETLARSAAAGSGCSTVVVVRPAGHGEYEQLAPPGANTQVALSRTLLEAATEGEVVLLRSGSGPLQGAQSIIDLGIRSALCAPVMLDDVPDCLLYLDSRAEGAAISDDVATFCRALAQLGASAIRRQLARGLAERREQLERDLDSARRAQQLLMPPREGARHHFAYWFESIPGRFVAGDLFDVINLSDNRTAFFLGDVSGKGAAASLLMAAAQSHLRAALVQGAPLTDCLASVNRFVHEHTETRTFITMIAGIYDPQAQALELADAGHGLCCKAQADQPAERLTFDGGLPIGVDADHPYASTTFTMADGDRLVAFSDGLIEQTDPAGDDQFGFERTLDALSQSPTPESDVRALVDAVQAHAQGPLADDLTVVSLRFGAQS